MFSFFEGILGTALQTDLYLVVIWLLATSCFFIFIYFFVCLHLCCVFCFPRSVTYVRKNLSS